MKKLLIIVASALTFGAYADAADTPIIVTGLDTAGITNGSTLTLVHDGEEVVSTTYNGESSMAFGTEGDGAYVITCDGTPVTEEIANTRGSAPKFASALPKMLASVEPVAVWEDLTGADQEGGLTYEGTSFTLSANGNTVAENGTIAIGSTGVKVTNFPENTSAFTIVVKYSGYTAPTESGTKAVIATARNSANVNRIGVYAGVGVTHGIWNGADNGSDVTGGLATEGIFALAYASDGKPGTALIQKGASALVFNNDGLKATGNNYDEAVIGAFNGSSTTYTPSTMTIEKVAVFASKLTQDDIDAFVFPSEDTTEVFNGTLPSADDIARFTDASWTGTVWLKNQTGLQNLNLNNYGNANSTVRLTGISGHQNQGSHVLPTVELVDETDANGNVTKKALDITNGWTANLVIIDKLVGSGTLDITAGPVKMLIKDTSKFKGVAKVTIDGEAGLIFGNVEAFPVSKGCVYDKKITIVGETPVQINNAWTAPQGIVVNGTLNVPSTIAKQSLECDLLVSADGTVNVGQNDWIKYSAESEQNINIKGTLDLGTSRQTLKANNKINIYPGATITGTATGVDGGCHINTFGANCVISMVADGANTEAATISAIIGPQGSTATIDVADGLTLNLAATASSSGAGRTNGLVKTGTGTLNITGKYNTLAGLTLNGGTIIVAEGATIPASGVVTTVQGKVVSCTDGVYTLVDDAPSAPGEEFIPEGEKAEYEAWAATNVPAGEYTTDQKANFAIAFHLGATISEGVTIEDAAQAKVEALVADIDLAALAGEGEDAALTTLNTELAKKGLVASLATVTLDGASETTKLYQLVIKLIEEN